MEIGGALRKRILGGGRRLAWRLLSERDKETYKTMGYETGVSAEARGEFGCANS